MSASRPEKTLADYLGIAISPVLIITLVGSLSFFLLEIGYAGDYAARLRWTLFWFVLASVLVSRISIEQGSGVAGFYGFGLAVVTGMMIHRFVGFIVIVWLLLAFIWWCASKLTWDCTLIDDDEDASGAGLLQVAGLDDSAKRASSAQGDAPNQGPQNLEATETAAVSAPATAWWRKLFQNRSEREDQPHSPGLWVVYFSLVALPAFGVGQLMIPSANTIGRRYGFALLLVYVGSALGLLLTTSFLGLRRYLRQRHLQMPPAMAASWVSLGASLAIGILLVCVLLPRPNARYSLTALVNKIGSPEQKSSDRWLLDDGSGEEASQQSGRRGDGGGDGEKQSGAGSSGQNAAQGEQQGSSMPNGSPSLSSRFPLAELLKWLVYAIFAAIVFYALYRHGAKLVATLKQMLREFLNFWRNLFGLKPRQLPAQDSPGIQEVMAAPPRPFSSFRNPFTSGRADRMSLAELVGYSFEALQGWARDFGYERRPEQTPFEFATLLSGMAPSLGSEVVETTRIYGRLAYAGQLPPPEAVEVLERLWHQMTESSRQPVAR
jgi:hypothetical protein